MALTKTIKKEKKFTVHDVIQQLKALDSFGIDIYEAELKIVGKGHIRIEDKKTKVLSNIYFNDDLFGSSIHVYMDE